ncbi:6,7-dimethyl-8-ribityllumazine synthase [Porticoccaceae bacterium]|jgi:6,7-dimethyl-8-ribityllumazine synthase|nr:6,7-dimethyl-8-ribityllumazine synthase [Porticoccaceae bacterium]MDA9014586.1 6,7-dimethyl-8-ribityllumazine synthase [Porticoccaceae bacterium]MDA9570183.1 6,7-dimethyl-8-ribityllumazine synthase [Porticoccaceae bacterium]
MGEFRPQEGNFSVQGARIAVITARWNSQVTDGLRDGALRALARHNVQAVEDFYVPGAFELPLAAQRAAKTGRFEAVITLGCVIRGDTPHFDYVCAETTRGIGEVSLNQDIPVAFGLLTTDNLQQAMDRAGDNNENKGEEAALTVLEMLELFKNMQVAK